MEVKIIIAGFGGQGVIMTGELLAQAGMLEKKNVALVPSYGPEMRGGTANCTVILKDSEIYSPVIAYPDILVALNQPSLERFESQVTPQGMIFFNSSLCTRKRRRKDIQYFGIPATEMASKLGNIRVTNVIMAGALIAETGLVPMTVLSEKVFPEVLKNKNASLLNVNRLALQEGWDYQKKTALRG